MIDARVLITGANGQLGSALRRRAERSGADILLLSRNDLDIADGTKVHDTLSRYIPTHVVNAAAYTAVDAAEHDSENAYAINRDGVAHLAAATRKIDCRLIHVSTDFVFDGTSGLAYAPGDTPNPLNVYGASKLAGEQVLAERLSEDVLILRTAWVYDGAGQNFLTTMLRLMRERDRLSVVEDQVGSPTSADSLADVIWRALEQGLTGLHHWTDCGVASRYDFAIAIAEEAVAYGLLDRAPHIEPVTSAHFPAPAARPASVMLDCNSTRTALSYEGYHWRNMLRKVLVDRLQQR